MFDQIYLLREKALFRVSCNIKPDKFCLGIFLLQLVFFHDIFVFMKRRHKGRICDYQLDSLKNFEAEQFKIFHETTERFQTPF